MAKSNGKRNGNGRRNNQTGPSPTPRTTLRRTFRAVKVVQLNNTSGAGVDQYCYYSKYWSPEPENIVGFKDCQQTFEFWKINRMRIKAQVGYNSYNQTYNTINLDTVASMQIWTAADFSANENISGTSILSYNNARVHTLSLNAMKTLVNTQVRLNLLNNTPHTILPANTWIDTSQNMTDTKYSGFQIFARMPGVVATNYLPEIQLIFEYDCEFKQPAYQNRPTSFESDFVGSKLVTIPDGSDPDATREYEVVSYTLNDSGNNIRLERSDGVAGSLDYDQEEFWEVYYYNNSGKYFGGRHSIYTGPIPRKPLGWTPSA